MVPEASPIGEKAGGDKLQIAVITAAIVIIRQACTVHGVWSNAMGLGASNGFSAGPGPKTLGGIPEGETSKRHQAVCTTMHVCSPSCGPALVLTPGGHCRREAHEASMPGNTWPESEQHVRLIRTRREAQRWAKACGASLMTCTPKPSM